MPTYNPLSAKMSRRQLLALSLSASAGTALASLSHSALAADKANNGSVFSAPTAQRPIRINFNENALGMSPKALDAARAAVAKANRYAKAEIAQLSQKLADVNGLKLSQLLLTAGSSEGIRAAIEAYAKPDAQLVIPELTYGDGEQFATVSGLKITKVPMRENWSFDIEGMKKAVADYAGSSIVYLVNPNNPTATITPADLIEPWIKSNPDNTLFIVDEAYAEFVNDAQFRSVAPLIKGGADNVILLKTFSKIYAMAGMRVGYAVADEKVIQRISGYVAGEKLNYPGVCAALVSVDDRAFIDYSKKSTDTARAIYVAALTELGLDYLPSHGNFVFHKVTGDLATYQKRMADANILVGRAFPPATGWCRTSLGTPEEMAFVAQTLRQFRQKGWI